jgi:hypothetical protein
VTYVACGHAENDWGLGRQLKNVLALDLARTGVLVSHRSIAALFLIQTAKSELEEAGAPQAEIVSKASDILTETTEKIADVLGEPDDKEAN